VRAEIELYIELRAEELRAEGLSPEEALNQAHAAFGDDHAVVDECLGIAARGYVSRRWEETMGSIIRDTKFAFRALRHSPRFVLAVCVTLALGIGANSAIFSVVNAVALQPLAYPESDRLFQVWTQFPEQGDLESAVSNAEFLDYAAETDLFEDMTAYFVSSQVLTDQGPPRPMRIGYATADVWSVFGGTAKLGRLFGEADDLPDSALVTVLSESTWQTVFGADPDIVGKTITLNGRDRNVIGVLEAGFQLPETTADVYEALGISREGITRRDGHYLTVVGRAIAGADLARIRAEMRTVTSRWTADYEHAHPLDAEPLREEVVGDSAFALLVLLAAVGSVLLIACANVAGLMMTRAVGRQRDMAIRTAIGAGRGQLVRQSLIEGLLLSLTGGLLGLGVAMVMLPAVLRLEPGHLPRLSEIRIDGQVVLFTLVVSTLCGLLFSVAPALRAASVNPSGVLAAGGRGSGDRSRQRFLRGIVLAEVALAMVLVAGAGLLTQSFSRLLGVDSGMQTDAVVTGRVTLPSQVYGEPADIRQFFGALRADLLEQPGVVAVGGVRALPLAQPTPMEIFLKEGEFRDQANPGRRFEYQFVTDGYFNAMGIELLAGRGFANADNPDSRRVAVINAAIAAEHFANSDPIGQRIRILASTPNDEEFVIVGIAANVLHDGLDGTAKGQIYVPHAQATEYFTGGTRGLSLVVRSQTNDPRATERIREAVGRLNADLAITRSNSMDGIVLESVSGPRFLVLLLGLLAGLAVTLAAVGVYSVVSYGVVLRTREFGIRLALGAQPQAVQRMVLVQGVQPALVGLGVGLIAALFVGQTLSALLFQTSPRDPVTLALVSGFLVLVAALAAWIPARRVVRVQPVEALSSE